MPSSSPAAASLRRLFDDEWQFRLAEDPLFATLVGDRRYDDRLPAVSESDFARRLERLRSFRDRLLAIERALLSPDDQLNYDIFARVLDTAIAELEFRTYLMPIAKVAGFHTSFADLPEYMPLETVEEYKRYIARLDAWKDYVDGYLDLMRAGIQQGYVPPRVVVEGVEDGLRPHIVADAAEHRLYRPFQQFPERIPDAERQQLAEAGRAAIMRSVVPGFQSLLDFLRVEYLPAARDTIAATALPNGPAFYQHRVRSETTLDLTPEQVHTTGLAEVERIRAEMEAIIRRVGFAGDFAAFVDFLRTDSRFYVDTPAALLKEVALVLKRMDGELPRLFRTLPRVPYGIREIPEASAPFNTTAYYFPPAGDGSRAGYYYVNTYDLPSRPLYEVEALSLHEAVPGHHLQIALQQELADVPDFRRFELFTAYVEGWALYSERLGLEVGFYQDPFSDFGRLTYEMWRACRLVVDTGMHALGWSRRQAIDFMAANTALTMLNIANEVDRYIAWPGQALAYKIGELEIRRLRAWAEQELGDRFDLREFHDLVLLCGAVPLDVLDARVSAWLAAASASA